MTQENEDLGVEDQLDEHEEVVENQDDSSEESTEEVQDARPSDKAESTDEEGHDDETEEEAEARRLRNRQRRDENKVRRKEYVESLKREIASRDEILRRQEERLAVIERRTQGADVAAVDAELQKAADAYQYFRQQHALAVSAADGQAAVEAQEKMMQASRRGEELTRIKQAAQRQVQNPSPPPLDPRLKMHAEDWLDRNDWYNPSGNDPDSAIALTIDQRLHKEGWDPTTEGYWKELDARMKKYLPHRYNSGYNASQTKPKAKSPVAGSGREAAGGKGTSTYRLSPERTQALKDSGMWDDPKQRAEAIRRYQEFDKQKTA